MIVNRINFSYVVLKVIKNKIACLICQTVCVLGEGLISAQLDNRMTANTTRRM